MNNCHFSVPYNVRYYRQGPFLCARKILRRGHLPCRLGRHQDEESERRTPAESEVISKLHIFCLVSVTAYNIFSQI